MKVNEISTNNSAPIRVYGSFTVHLRLASWVTHSGLFPSTGGVVRASDLFSKGWRFEPQLMRVLCHLGNHSSSCRRELGRSLEL